MSKINLYAVFVFVLAYLPLACAQHCSEWSAPVNLGPVVNSPGVEQGPATSKDGLSLYLGWSPLGTGIDIYVSQRATINDPWGPPQKLGPHINYCFCATIARP